MDFYELLEYLELESPEEFEYFEAMADLAESDDPIEQEAVYQLFAGAPETMLEELFGDYFDDLLEGLPEDAGEIYSLLHQIRLSLTGLASGAEEEHDFRLLTDEFCRFRNGYVYESDVELDPADGGPALHQSLRDAITSSRLEKLGGPSYRYSFEGALTYELDSYAMSFGELAAAEDDYNSGTIVFDPSGERDDEDSILSFPEGGGYVQ